MFRTVVWEFERKQANNIVIGRNPRCSETAFLAAIQSFEALNLEGAGPCFCARLTTCPSCESHSRRISMLPALCASCKAVCGSRFAACAVALASRFIASVYVWINCAEIWLTLQHVVQNRPSNVPPSSPNQGGLRNWNRLLGYGIEYPWRRS